MKDPETLSLRKHSKGQNGKKNKQTNKQTNKKKNPQIPAQAWGWEQRLVSLSKH